MSHDYRVVHASSAVAALLDAKMPVSVLPFDERGFTKMWLTGRWLAHDPEVLAAIRRAAEPVPPASVSVPSDLLPSRRIGVHPLWQRTPEEQAHWDDAMAAMNDYIERVYVAENQAFWQRYVDMVTDWFAKATLPDPKLDTPGEGG